MLKEIQDLSGAVYPQVVNIRRHLHANPELSFVEYQTSLFIRGKLDELNIPWTAMADTGTVALIRGDLPSDNVVALRADIDALPITERNTLEYSSRQPGVMHACGHDAHTASLLGTASILQSFKHRFAGTVKLIFQPGEETLPGGAVRMIQEGVLENPKPVAVIGQHVMPSLPAGKIGIKPGRHMASIDNLDITVYGKGGHGAQPHLNVDPVVISAHLIVALQQLVSRFANPAIPTVLSFGKVTANGSYNIIPNEVKIEGTFRTMNEEWRKDALQRMKQLAEGLTESMGGQINFTITLGYPVLFNEEKLSGEVQQYVKEYVGEKNLVDLDIWMASEDFAYYSQVTDSCFYLLGVGNTEKGITSSLHTPDFNIDEDALSISAGLMAYIALRKLGNV